MLSSSTQNPGRARGLSILVIALLVFETILVTSALVPAQLWTRLLPDPPGGAREGPFPPMPAPITPALLYLVPTVMGFLCSSWQRALLYATIPAWIGLGLFVIAAATKVGPFYLISPNHVTSNVSVLELFAPLGAITCLARPIFKLHSHPSPYLQQTTPLTPPPIHH